VADVGDLGRVPQRGLIERRQDRFAQFRNPAERPSGHTANIGVAPRSFEIRLIADYKSFRMCCFRQYLAIGVVKARRAVQDDERQVGHRQRLPRPLYAFGLDAICRVTQTRCVDERHAHAVEVDHFGDQIAGRARHVGDDRARCSDERIEHARFPDVRLPDDRHLKPFANEASVLRIGEQSPGAIDHGIDFLRQRAGLDEVIALFGKIDGRFESCDEIEEGRVDVGDGSRQRALQLIERRTRLQRRHRVDQIGDGFGLH
jgi:hypothetical protein